MRKRFNPQLVIGQKAIQDTPIPIERKNVLNELLAALKQIYCNKEYNEKIFSVLERHLVDTKKKTGRKGMDLWIIFVLAQVRLCLNKSYDELHDLANNHHTIRHLMGVEFDFGFPRVTFGYQNIYDNVTSLSDELLQEINAIILEFGHREVFKKKAGAALRLKTDSFVVESNVHFPTDYNLLWDCARKCMDTINKILEKHPHLTGWRKLPNWRYEIKGLMRELGKASSSGGKGKPERVLSAGKKYLKKAVRLSEKIHKELPNFPLDDIEDMGLSLVVEGFTKLLDKHIDLVNRRVIKGEKIPHEEKMFSIFEGYTEWVKKGKMYPNVELGKKLSITTDQHGLIVDYRLMTGKQQDRDIVVPLADDLLNKYNILSWSFDKGFWRKENKELLQLAIPEVIMPKLGKRNKAEEQEESTRAFKRLKNKHSTIESNINELENRGLDRCPDRGLHHFTRYISLAVSAYNLKKIGRYLMELERKKLEKQKQKLKQAA